MSGLRMALVWSLAERYLLIVLALASNVILARLLTPEEVGIYSVSLAVIGIAQVLRDFGIGNFLIQERELSDDHVRTAFGLSLLMGGTLFVLTFSLADVLARWYDEPRMAVPLRICALNFIVLPFCSISLALLRREMQFKRLLYVSLSSTVVGFVVTVGLAWRGTGPSSMAVGSVVMNVVTGIGAWLARDERRFLAPSFKSWRQMTRFGAHSSAASVVTSVAMDINDLALAKILGFGPVAMYSRAQGLMQMFTRDVMGAIRNVALPAYAQALRSGEAVEALYVKSVSSVVVLGWPFFGFMAMYGHEVIHVLYGAQWRDSAALVPVLAIAGAAQTVASLAYPAVTAAGRVELVSRAELIFQPLRAAAVVAAGLLTQSLLACAVAYMVMLLLYAPLAYYVKQRCLPHDWPAMVRELGRCASITALTLLGPAAIAWYAGWHRPEAMPLGLFAAAVSIGTLSWVLATLYLRHPIGIDRLVTRWYRNRNPVAP